MMASGPAPAPAHLVEGQEEAKAGGAASFMALAAEAAAEDGSGGSTGAAAAYGGASRKLEELFVFWLSQKETGDMVEHCVTAVRQGQTLMPCDSALEVGGRKGPLCGSGNWIADEGQSL